MKNIFSSPALASLVAKAEIVKARRKVHAGAWRRRDKPKLVLIETKPPDKHVYSKLKLPRLGAVLLGTIARDYGWDVRVYVEELAEVDYEEVLTADLVGISSTTSTALRSYAIADAVRTFDIPVVMGGPHVTFLVEEALQHCDYVVRGEGEQALIALMDAIFGRRELSSVPNLSYRDESGAVCHNEQSSTIDDLDSLPFPDFNLIKGFKQTRSFFLRPIIPIQATRGCPFGCKFCSVIGMFGRKMRYRSVDNVIEELKRLDNPNTHVFFYDDNFAANPKWTKDLLSRGLLKQNLCKSWSSQVRTDAARDDELLDLMQRTNCTTVYIGFESVNPDALEEMNKHQSVDDMIKAVTKFKKHGIDNHGMFIFGFDTDTKKSLLETTRFAVRSGIGSVQFLILTPLPGTPMYDEFVRDGRITVDNYSVYDGHHVVYRPANVSSWDLQWAQMRAHAMFYSRRRALKHMIKGSVARSFIYLYARGLNRYYARTNKFYLKALKLAEKARGMDLNLDFEFDLSDIWKQVGAAAESLITA